MNKTALTSGNKFPTALLIPILFLMLQCTPVTHPHEEAGDISIVDNKIVGFIYEPDGSPAANASVVLRPADYLPAVSALAKRKDDKSTSICTTITNEDGLFMFKLPENIALGTYGIEATGSDRKNSLYIDSVVIDSLLIHSAMHILIDTPAFDPKLKPPAVITGTIVTSSPDVENGIVRVFGLAAYTRLDKNGSFTLDNIPAGEFRITITFSETNSSEENSFDVTGETGKTTTLDTFYQLTRSFAGDNEPVTGGLYQSGETITAPAAPEKEGFEFIGWTTSEDSVVKIFFPGETIIINETTHTLHPQWKPVWYKLLHYTSGKGNVTVPSSVSHGVPTIISATPEDGEAFLKWSITKGNASIAQPTSMITEITVLEDSVTIQAIFSPMTFFKTYPNTIFAGSYFGDIIQHTSDGGYIFAAMKRDSNTISGPTRWVKTDPLGDTIWTRTFSPDLPIIHILQNNDGEYIGLNVGAGSGQFSLCKITSTGTLVWNNTYTEEYGGYWGQSTRNSCELMQADDNGFLIVIPRFSVNDNGGHVERAAVLLKISPEGEKQWTKYLWDFEGVRTTSRKGGNGYFITGTNMSIPADSQSMLMKTDSEGNTEWEKPLSDPFRSLRSTSDGGCFFIGKAISSQNSDTVYYYGEFDENGDRVWIRQTPYTVPNTWHVVEQIQNQGFVMAGGSWVEEDIFLRKMSPEESWTKSMASYQNEIIARVNYIQQTADGGYILAGLAQLEKDAPFSMYLLKTDENGDLFQTNPE